MVFFYWNTAILHFFITFSFGSLQYCALSSVVWKTCWFSSYSLGILGGTWRLRRTLLLENDLREWENSPHYPWYEERIQCAPRVTWLNQIWLRLPIFFLFWTPLNASTSYQFLKYTTCLDVSMAQLSLVAFISLIFCSKFHCHCSHLIEFLWC